MCEAQLILAIATAPYILYTRVRRLVMFVKLTSKRQVTFPARVVEGLGIRPGDRIELVETTEGFLLKASRLEPGRLGPLRGKLSKPDAVFDVDVFRRQPHDPSLRD